MRFRCFVAVAAVLICIDGLAAQGLINVPVREFARTGPTDEVLRTLVGSIRQGGVFSAVVGFENVGDTGHSVSVKANQTNLETVLQSICAQDASYRVVKSDSTGLINLLAANDKVPGHDVLAFQIPNLDIESDINPPNLIMRLADYSPELSAYLRAAYVRLGGDTEAGGAGVIFGGNEALPHFSVHLKNVSVREALNAISLESFRLYQATGVDPRLVGTPDQLRVTPVGWEYRYVNPNGMSFYNWVRQIFRRL